jgi:hypothetical protein
MVSANSASWAERSHDALAQRVAANQRRLQHAGDQHTPGRGITGAGEPCGEREGCHHGEVEKDRRRGRSREAMPSIEDAAPQSHQCDEQEIGKRDARQRNRERELLRFARKARREYLDHLRRED